MASIAKEDLQGLKSYVGHQNCVTVGNFLVDLFGAGTFHDYAKKLGLQGGAQFFTCVVRSDCRCIQRLVGPDDRPFFKQVRNQLEEHESDLQKMFPGSHLVIGEWLAEENDFSASEQVFCEAELVLNGKAILAISCERSFAELPRSAPAEELMGESHPQPKYPVFETKMCFSYV